MKRCTLSASAPLTRGSRSCSIASRKSLRTPRCQSCGKAIGSAPVDRKSTRLNSSHLVISYAVFCLKKQNRGRAARRTRPRPSDAERRAHAHALPPFPTRRSSDLLPQQRVDEAMHLERLGAAHARFAVVLDRVEEITQDATVPVVRESHRVGARRSEEHTSELQSPCNLVCRLLLEKTKPRARRPPHPAPPVRRRASRPRPRSTPFPYTTLFRSPTAATRR